jgi:hypothetical protein
MKPRKLTRAAFQAWGAEGGKTAARKRTAEERSASAQKAVLARWAKAKKKAR